ncbi:tetratricopeptide repeat protein [Wolbachia pipientis]|uniref:tetratricopeptide repeat protein n=1 Tax=Wolbachia pipientis TaxID=955 RepID=UPI0015FBD4B0|nr:tetratricopeptide repeat protein [Wolbachia pipientis]
MKKKELLVRALIIQEKHYGPDHFIVAKLLTNLGGVYIVLGDPKKAKTLLARALIIQEKHYSFGHSGVVKTLINLGNAYGDLGDHKKKGVA